MVYALLLDLGYEGTPFLGVFSTREKAERAADARVQQYGEQYGGRIRGIDMFIIVPCELDRVLPSSDTPQFEYTGHGE